MTEEKLNRAQQMLTEIQRIKSTLKVLDNYIKQIDDQSRIRLRCTDEEASQLDRIALTVSIGNHIEASVKEIPQSLAREFYRRLSEEHERLKRLFKTL